MVTPTCAPSRCEMTAQSQGVQVHGQNRWKALEAVCLSSCVAVCATQRSRGPTGCFATNPNHVRSGRLGGPLIAASAAFSATTRFWTELGSKTVPGGFPTRTGLGMRSGFSLGMVSTATMSTAGDSFLVIVISLLSVSLCPALQLQH